MIRPATIDDLPALMRLAIEMHRESRFRDWSFDEGKVGTLFLRLIQDADSFVWVAADSAGRAFGAMVGCVFEHWFSTERCAQDFGLFVMPDRRGGLAAFRLVRRYIAWAAERGAREVDLGVNTGVTPEATGRLLECAGLRRVATLYSKVLACA